MESAKGILSGFGGITLALISTTLWLQRGEKATGIDVLRALFGSFAFWALAAVLSALFFAASQFQNKILRAVLFWTPTILLTAIGMGFAALLTILLRRT